MAEKNKTEQSKVSGSGADDVYKSKWQYFDRLSFLADNVTPRGTSSKVVGKKRASSAQGGGTGGSASQDCAYDIESAAPSAKSTRKIETARTNQLIEDAINVLNRPVEKPKPVETNKTGDQLFSEMICKQLETMNEGQEKDFLKMNIQRLIYEAKYFSNTGRQQQASVAAGVYSYSGNTGQFTNNNDIFNPTFYNNNDTHRPSSNIEMHRRSSSTFSSPQSQYSTSIQGERGSFLHAVETDSQQDI